MILSLSECVSTKNSCEFVTCRSKGIRYMYSNTSTNVFNSTCRVLTLDVLSGRPSRDYACGLNKEQALPTGENLSNLFVISKSCGQDTLNYDALTGSDGFTWERSKQVDRRGTPQRC
jgi:hypothetical protein